MDWAILVSISKKQAAVPPGVLRIALDDLSSGYNPPNFCSADHTIRPQHLTQCVRKEKKLLLGRRSNLDQNLRLSPHSGIRSVWSKFFNGYFVSS
jgi:hypothetical protein